MALDRRNYRQLVETTVVVAQKTGCSQIVGRIVEDLKDESEPYRRMVMETIDKARFIFIFLSLFKYQYTFFPPPHPHLAVRTGCTDAGQSPTAAWSWKPSTRWVQGLGFDAACTLSNVAALAPAVLTLVVLSILGAGERAAFQLSLVGCCHALACCHSAGAFACKRGRVVELNWHRAVTQVVQDLGTADIDARLEELLIDGILYAFQEQVRYFCSAAPHP
jgi:hypothetical protein